MQVELSKSSSSTKGRWLASADWVYRGAASHFLTRRWYLVSTKTIGIMMYMYMYHVCILYVYLYIYIWCMMYMCSGLQQKHTGFYVVGDHLCRSTLISPVVNLTPLGFEWSLKGGESVALFQIFFSIFIPTNCCFMIQIDKHNIFQRGFGSTTKQVVNLTSWRWLSNA